MDFPFVYLQRYYVYISALVLMERDCFGNIDFLCKTIRGFFAPRIGKEETENLVRLARMLYDTGYRFSAVNVDLSDWSEWDAEEDGKDYDQLTLEEIRERNEKAKNKALAERYRIMREYTFR